MPSRAYTPFLPRIPIQELKQHLVCQCPLGLIPHFYWSQSFSLMHITWASVSMPSRAYTPFLRRITPCFFNQCVRVNALSGLYPISTMILSHTFIIMNPRVNALSGLYPISTENTDTRIKTALSVSMPSRAYTPFLLESKLFIDAHNMGICVNALSGLYPISTSYYPLFLQSMCSCQCPLGLIPHFYYDPLPYIYYYESSCQCPLGLIPHFYGTPSKT